MNENKNEWDYCDIKFQLRYKGEDTSHTGGFNTVWLVFKAVASKSRQSYTVSEAEIPVAGNVAGVSFVPQKNNPGHLNIHQNLLQELQKDGWELLTDKRGAWWERRFRRPAQAKSSIVSQLMSWLTA